MNEIGSCSEFIRAELIRRAALPARAAVKDRFLIPDRDEGGDSSRGRGALAASTAIRRNASTNARSIAILTLRVVRPDCAE